MRRAFLGFTGLFLGLFLATAGAGPLAAQSPQGEAVIGIIADRSGRTARVGAEYADGLNAALSYLRERQGRSFRTVSADMSYLPPLALTAFEEWRESGLALAAVLGWAAADSETLSGPVRRAGIPYLSAAYQSRFTDPDRFQNIFPLGPSFEQGLSGLLRWAREDWQARQADAAAQAKPAFLYLAASDDDELAGFAEQQAGLGGFDVLAARRYGRGDDLDVCRALADQGADYVYLAGGPTANLELLRACDSLEIRPQWITHAWGYDTWLMAEAGIAADGVVWVMPTHAYQAGLPLAPELAAALPQASAPGIHFMKGLCAGLYLGEVLKAAGEPLTGSALISALESGRPIAPAGFGPVCPPLVFSPDSHAGSRQFYLYRGSVERREQGGIDTGMTHIFTVPLGGES